MRRIFSALLTSACMLAVTDASAASADRGRLLYETNCVACHTPSIHKRPNKIPLSRDELRMLVDHFRRSENLGWTPEEVEDVVEYLNVTRYHFPPRSIRQAPRPPATVQR